MRGSARDEDMVTGGNCPVVTCCCGCSNSSSGFAFLVESLVSCKALTCLELLFARTNCVLYVHRLVWLHILLANTCTAYLESYFPIFV